MNYEEAKEKLIKCNQEHVLMFYDELSDAEKQELLNQIENIDFEKLNQIYENRIEDTNNSDVIEPLDYIDKMKLSSKELEDYTAIGEKIITEGKFAFATLAGGQGTRLGHKGPKGTFKLGINPDKSLFEIMCDSLKQAKREYNVYIPWYIMTSRENNDETIEFFEVNNYFGYPKDKITFFKQEELPMVSVDGKVLMETKGRIKEAADGHGGILWAMQKNGIIEDMQEKGIKWCFIGGIDNVLLKMVDPLLIGVSEDKGVKLASKTIVKASPDEKVGVFCRRNGKPSVIEYTEITDEMAHMCDDEGELLYGESHILCNLFSVEALKLVEDENLPYHTAFKKCAFVDNMGRTIQPMDPNAYKFETFIFDAFSKFDDMVLLRSLREEEFAPVKNKEGVDSPKTARDLYKAYWNI